MIRDVFYYGDKPNAHPREKFVKNFEEAKKLATTEHFWIINEYCDYTNFDWEFDFEFLPDNDVWAVDHINIWPSHYQKDSGTWLAANNDSYVKIYRNDVTPIMRKNVEKNWKIFDVINIETFDLKWHPDPTDPPYIYAWGCKHFPPTVKSIIEYHVPGATEYRYMSDIVELKPEHDKWKILQEIDKTKFDLTWRPNPLSPPYIYVWGNKYINAELKSTIEYHCTNAIEYKYMEELIEVLPELDKWNIVQDIDKTKFDLSWRPDPREPPFIYVWGNKYIPGELKPTVTYTCTGATEYKYMEELVEVLPELDKWIITQEIDTTKFDLSWRPDPREPPYIYVWGNKYIPSELKPTVEYHCLGATEKKYMSELVNVIPDSNWVIHQEINKSSFDLSWRPDPREPPFIYVWGNKYIPGELKPTLEYIVPSANQRKYMGDVEVIPEYEKYNIIQQVINFDFSWRPDPREPAYIYTWGNKYIPAEVLPTLEYICANATERKYMGDLEVLAEYDRYIETHPIDKTKFDMAWRPDPREPPYIYTWGNKHIPAEIQPTLEYVVPNAIERKYMGDLNVLPLENWKITQQVKDFDFTWRPDPREPPYIYVWGNKYIPGELKPTLEYYTPEATERKYMGDVTVVPEWEKYKILIAIDTESFDFSWRPDPREPPFIYVWGNQAFSGEIEPTVEYHCEYATERKYLNDRIAKTLVDKEKFKILIPVTDFDFSWRPDPHSPPYIYVFGNQWNDAITEPTIEYYVEGATERKYVTDIIAKVSNTLDNWNVIIPVDNFDYSWRPNPHSPPYIYVFGNQWHDAMTEPTVEYHVKGATERKYVTDIIAIASVTSENWKELISVDNFDYSWRPNPHSPPYIYVFGNQWHDAMTEPTVEYHVKGATEKKYITDIIAIASVTSENWKELISVDNFDYSWRPNPHSSPYIYVFGNQWNPIELEHTIEYHTPGATEYKYISDIIAYLKPTKNDNKWKTLIPVESFDYSWRPDPREPALIYVFGNKWNDAKTEPTVEYHCEGAIERKFMDFPIATTMAEFKYWSILGNYNDDAFDYSWRPNPFSPPQIYQWEDNGPRYIVPGATDVVLMKKSETSKPFNINRYFIKTNLVDLILEHPDEVFWALNPDLNYDKFDFKWRPNSDNFRHINVFGNEYSKNTQTYFVNSPMYHLGYKEFNYIDEHKLTGDTNLSMFFVDKGNKLGQERFDILKKKYPQLQKTRYLNSWVDTINRCVTKSSTKLFWVLSSELDYSNFVFDFYPSPWQEKMVHVFGTQWSHWGNTYFINKETFSNDSKYIKIIEHLSCLNFVKTKRALASDIMHDIVCIDYKNTNIDIEKYDLVIEYEESYYKTFKKLLDILPIKKEHHIWIVSSICDYSDFDFTYICDPFSKEQLHVFPSYKQKFGDTFFVDVNKLRDQLSSIERLEKFTKINFNNHQTVKRLPCPKILVNQDTLVNCVNFEYEFPYANFITKDNANLEVNDTEPINLWDTDTKNIIVQSTGSTNIIVPKEIKNYVKKELYDYPYITKRNKLVESTPLDIIFLSNGEKNADENYEHLLKITKNIPNKILRVDKIAGRKNANYTVANASSTPWMFVVFAKLKVNNNFDWNWQPDRMQIPKHYIFYAHNPLNGLVYGHQAMVAWNKNIVLNTIGNQLDFTMEGEHEVIKIDSGVANYNTDEFSTWRTAFREAIKLKFYSNKESEHRLRVWLTIAEGDFAQYSIDGANHALEYYEEVNGDYMKLRNSYDWPWLQEYFNNKYK